MERHSFRMLLGESPETMRKLCLSTKFPHQEIRWNYGILRSVWYHIISPFCLGFQVFRSFFATDIQQGGTSNWSLITLVWFRFLELDRRSERSYCPNSCIYPPIMAWIWSVQKMAQSLLRRILRNVHVLSITCFTPTIPH